MQTDNEQAFELLRQMANGNEAALRKMYSLFSRKIYAFALNRLKDPGQAEEIVVDTMHEVWKFPLRFRGESKFSTWLLGIARNKVLSALRSRDPEPDELDETMPALEPGVFELLAQKQRPKACVAAWTSWRRNSANACTSSFTRDCRSRKSRQYSNARRTR